MISNPSISCETNPPARLLALVQPEHSTEADVVADALQAAWVQALQQALNARGFDSGAADGVAGPATRAALRRWQRHEGLPADGFPTTELLQRLQVQ